MNRVLSAINTHGFHGEQVDDDILIYVDDQFRGKFSMRLPKVGEEGWQVLYKSRWFDCQIVAIGPFEGADGWIAQDGSIVIEFDVRSIAPSGLWCVTDTNKFRRKPEQKDNQAAPNTFAEIMDSFKRAGEYMERVR